MRHMIYRAVDIWCVLPQGGGCSNHFLMGCAVRGLKPLPISKDFSPSKTADLTVFPRAVHISEGFSTSKMADFSIFMKWDPVLKDFLTKIGLVSKNFW